MKICPYCGNQNSDDSLFCTECGKSFPQGTVCPHCGASISDDDAFCCNCGRKVDEQPAPDTSKSLQRKCPHCGASVNDDDVFCQNCGKKIAEDSMPTSTEPSNDADASSDDVEVHVRGNDDSLAMEREVSDNVWNTDSTLIFNNHKKILYAILALLFIGGGWFCYNNFFKHRPAKDPGVELAPLSENKDRSVKYMISDYDNHVIASGEFEFEAKLVDAADNIYTKTYKIAVSNKKVILSDGYYEYYGKVDDDMNIEVSYDPNDGIHGYLITLSPTNRAGTEWKGDYQSNAMHCDLMLKQNSANMLSPAMLQKIKDGSMKQIENRVEEEDNDSPTNNLDWLQGHWVYEQGSYKSHSEISGNTIKTYSNMNPSPEIATFTIDGDELIAKTKGMATVVKIDLKNHRLDWGDGHWMHKVSSSSSQSYSNTTSSSNSQQRQRPFTDGQDIMARLYNQRFRHSSGLEIRIDGYGRIEIDGDAAGVLSVLRYNSESALLRYGNGMYGEGKILLKINGDKLLLQDTADGSVFYQR